MIFVAVTCVVTCIALMLLVCLKPSIKIGRRSYSIYWAAPLLGASCVLITGKLSIPELLAGLTANTAMNPIKILILFLSMTLLSVFLDATGFFNLLAAAVLRRAQFSQTRLFVYLYLIVSVLTVVTSNDVVVLTFTPFICYFAVNANIKPLPYLLCSFVAANTWSMALLIGNPTNMYLAADIDFMSFLQVMLLPTVLAGATSFFILWLLFRKQLRAPIEKGYPQFTVKDPVLLIIGVVHLAVCILLLIISAYISLPMWSIALGAFISLLVISCTYLLCRRKPLTILLSTFKRAPFETIPFVLSMFTLVLALEKYGVTATLAQWLSGSNAVWTYGFSSFLAANVINNIPMSVLFSTVIDSPAALFAAVIGSNIGAYCTPLGALAGIMFKGQLKSHGVSLSFLQFIRYGTAIAVPTLTAALLGLLCTT